MLKDRKFCMFAVAYFGFATHLSAQAIDHDYAGDNTGVGEVIVSVLQPSDFRIIYGPDWALLDGQNVSSQPIAEFLPVQLKTRNEESGETTTVLPDARGRFLRMANHGTTGEDRDADGDRSVGNLQSDTLSSHGHSYSGIQIRGGDSRAGPEGNNRFNALRRDEHATPTSGAYGEAETRPSNIAINYYVRVACTTGGKCGS